MYPPPRYATAELPAPELHAMATIASEFVKPVPMAVPLASLMFKSLLHHFTSLLSAAPQVFGAIS